MMFFLIAIIFIIADQLTKMWAASTFPLGGQGQYVGLGFYLTYIKNTGAAFGIFQDGTLILGLLSATVSLFIFLYLIFNIKKIPKLQSFALSLILSGAIGNMIDRFRLGYVIDFIHFNVQNFSFPVFNIADSCVVVGASLLIISNFFAPKKELALEPEPTDKELSDADFFSSMDFERKAES